VLGLNLYVTISTVVAQLVGYEKRNVDNRKTYNYVVLEAEQILHIKNYNIVEGLMRAITRC